MAITGILALIFIPVWWLTPWHRVLNVQDPSLAWSSHIAMAAVAAIFLANFPLSIVGTIYNAHQRGYVSNLFSIVASLVSLGVLVLVSQLDLGLVWLIMGGGCAGIVVTIMNFRWILHDMPWLSPRWKHFDWKTFRALQGVSLAMLLFQLGALLINQVQNIIISHRINLDAVADYGILMRVYFLPTVVTAMVDAPMQTALREAYVRGEHDWVRQAFWRMTKLKMIIALVAAPLYPLAGNAVSWLLTGNAVRFDTRTWLATSALLVVAIWNMAFNDIMIAVGRVWPLVWAIIGNAVVTGVSTWVFAKQLGIFGVMVAYPLYSLLVTAWLLPWLVRDVLWPKAATGTGTPAKGASAAM
jgi:O-antigen/teichoic acid export membrane protein